VIYTDIILKIIMIELVVVEVDIDLKIIHIDDEKNVFQ
jgi:hypothetical protein